MLQGQDWQWLIKKVENRINLWCYKWLSLGGRLTLVSTVLTSIPVFWMSLAIIPATTINLIRSKIFKFLWSGSIKHSSKVHLTNWESMSCPKVLGGWGIKHLTWFNIALSLKNIWKGLCGRRFGALFLMENT
jgi:hypothetical protein